MFRGVFFRTKTQLPQMVNFVANHSIKSRTLDLPAGYDKFSCKLQNSLKNGMREKVPSKFAVATIRAMLTIKPNDQLHECDIIFGKVQNSSYDSLHSFVWASDSYGGYSQPGKHPHTGIMFSTDKKNGCVNTLTLEYNKITQLKHHLPNMFPLYSTELCPKIHDLNVVVKGYNIKSFDLYYDFVKNYETSQLPTI